MKDLLSNDHAEIDALLAKAYSALSTENAQTAFECVDLLWARLAMHIRAEHLHLFPALLETSSPGVAETLDRLRDDHNYFMQEFVRVIKLMGKTTDEMPAEIRDQVAGALRSIEERLKLHNRIEENAIYPLTENLRPEQKAGDLAASIQKELANLPPRFADRKL